MNRKGSKEQDYLDVEINCLDPQLLHATLVSSAGSHCEVWRTSKRYQHDDEQFSHYDFVIKYPTVFQSTAEIKILQRDYNRLKHELEEIIPEALFFITDINQQKNVCVIAEAVDIWFNIANPQNHEEALELLRNNRRAYDQLERFIRCANQWRHADNARLIDLYGVDNLIMDRNYQIRYIDNFFVFFYEDMLDMMDEYESQSLSKQIETSISRLEYLQELLQRAKTDV